MPLNFAILRIAQVIVHNPVELNELAIYAQALTFAITQELPLPELLEALNQINHVFSVF